MKKKSLVITTALVAAVAAALGCYWPFGNRTPVLELPGTVEVQEVRLGSKVGGRVADVNIREGETVQPGQILVRFEAPELEAQRDQWQARVQAGQAALERATSGPRSEDKEAAQATAEAARARWQLLKAGSRSEEIRQAQAEVKSAEVSLLLATQEYDRTNQMRTGGAAAQGAQDAARAELGRARAKLDLNRAKLDLLVAGSRPEEVAEAAAQLRRAEASALLLQNGTRSEDLAEAEAQLKEARGKLREVEANLAEAVVRAPEAAVVEVLAVRKGDLMQPNQPVVRVLRADDLWVKVYVPETQLAQIRLGQEVEVRIDSYRDRRFTGTVEQIAGESEYTPRNVQSADERRHQVFAVKVRVADAEGVFKSGMAAEVRVPLQ
jgi:multidrug resistance efflux pump